jgi:hypothetical protein
MLVAFVVAVEVLMGDNSVARTSLITLILETASELIRGLDFLFFFLFVVHHSIRNKYKYEYIYIIGVFVTPKTHFEYNMKDENIKGKPDYSQ